MEKVVRPQLTEKTLPDGSRGNWVLTDAVSGKILWQEWGDDTLGKLSYDFENGKELWIPNPNRIDSALTLDNKE